jgi:citrate synthase
MDRLRVTVMKVRMDYEHTLDVECSMCAASDVVRALGSTESDCASAYNAALTSMKIHFSLSLSRLLDDTRLRKRNGRAPNSTDLASVPLLIRFIRQKRCRDLLVKENPGAAKSIDAALRTYSAKLCSHSAVMTRRKLKALRNHYLAHSLILEAKLPGPRFNQLFSLSRSIGVVVSHLCSAIEDYQWDIDSERDVLSEQARQFWSMAFSASSTSA